MRLTDFKIFISISPKNIGQAEIFFKFSVDIEMKHWREMG